MPACAACPSKVTSARDLPHDAAHDPEGPSLRVEHRTLFDVALQVSDRSSREARAGNVGRLQAEAGDGLAHGDAIRILPSEQRLVYLADERAAADERDAEPDAFLLRETDDFEAERKPARRDQPHQGDAEQHPEYAVERTGVRNRIQVRADEQARGARVGSGIASPHVARRVDADLHAGLHHPSRHVSMDRTHRRRQEGPGDVPRLLRMGGQRPAPRHDLPRQIRGHHVPRYVL